MKTGMAYTTDNSDLYIYVNKIFHESDEYYKAKVTLYYKYGEYKNYVCEDRKSYKIQKKNIGYWYEYY